MIPSHPLESSCQRMLDFFFFFLFEFPSLLLGIWLAVNTAQTLNGLQSSKVFFPLLVCLFLLPNLWHLCVRVWSLCGTETCGWTCPLTDRAIEPTYRETSPPFYSLNICVPRLHTPVLPQFLCPACLSQRCYPACLQLSHSPRALSSAGGKTLG